ncbi:hypothetical protein BCR34DRAFT_599325 [Clohesyomyces aquaticus]|uniref:Nephrocystin 3-like N-terminal domain-containing protein n=1 Tax=Clohesyomyces aquaticus TaxID=1231657 RepID=A0A1Y1ZWA3_9PLEO|nr:hypothetical protein BCR34DRAFT_599325 [Clohesyomyces aquaticus]
MSSAKVSDFGFSEIYRPADKDPVVDFVFVHGLQGHPYRTWASSLPKADAQRKKTGKSKIRGLLPKTFRSKNNTKVKADAESVDDAGNAEASDHSKNQVFWPGDLLPSECPDARILVWGYDTRIARWGKAVNKNHLYSHGKDFLYSLCRQRKTGQPIVFIAHSLGGIVVKEALAISSDADDDPDTSDVIKCTGAVVFMGTPHRGSEDMAATGEKGRKIASALLVDSSSSVLDSLGLENADLERCHDKFTQLWEKHEFRVKTFQEGRGLRGVNLGPLNEKVVPHLSSLIGNPKEKAETLDADHREMCRFHGASDNNYYKVGPEIKNIYDSIRLRPSWYEQYETFRQQREFERNCRDLLVSLHFDGKGVRQQSSYNALDGTCRWILKSSCFNSWLRGEDELAQPGLLWIKGKLGSGKSTLMKEASRLLKRQYPDGNSKIASFFFASQRRTELDSTFASHGKTEPDSTPLGLFRSLLHQLLPEFPAECLTLIDTYQRKLIDQSKVQWTLLELQDTFIGIFSKPQIGSTFIFVDGIDECEDTTARDLVRFFRRATVEAHKAGAKLNICFSSQNTFTVTNPFGATIPLCHQIALEDNNSTDIAQYVSQSLRLGNPSEGSGNAAKWSALEREVVEKSSGVFLWVVLVVNLLQNAWDDGLDIGYLRDRLVQVPIKLEELYVELIWTIAPSEVSTVLHVLQWVLLSRRPLELAEWHHIMAFIANPELPSLKVWQNSKNYTSSDEQLAKRLGKICVGLVEVKDRSIPLPTPGTASELGSLLAGAGSFESGRYLYAIHDSVREFFLNGPGFRLLDLTTQNPRGDGHLYLLQTCINYGYLEEMNIFRVKKKTEIATSSDSSTTDSNKALVRRPQSHLSFGSSASLGLSINSLYLSPELLTFRNHRLELFDFGPVVGHHKAVELSANFLNRLDLPANTYTENPSAKTPVLSVEQRQLRLLLEIRELGSWIETRRLEPLVPQPAWMGAEQVRSNPRNSPSLATEVVSLDSEVVLDGSTSSMRATTIAVASIVQPSVSTHYGSYMIIPEVPSLSHYVQDMLVFHAIAAEAECADPFRVLDKLFSRGWRDWASTREDMRGERSPLQFAARWNLISWLRWLESIDWMKENPEEVGHSIIVAVHNGNEEALIFLLNRLHVIENRLWFLRKAFHHAAALKTSSILSLLCDAEKDLSQLILYLDSTDSKGRIPLHIAAQSSSSNVVNMLLGKHSNPRTLDDLGNSPLHAACNRNEQDMEMCRILIDSGCDITVRNNDGLRALDLARRNGFYDVVEYIQAEASAWAFDAAASSGDSSIFAMHQSTRSSLSQ